MLKLCRAIEQLDFRQLMDVYEESNQVKGRCDYPGETEGLQLLFAEQDFYQYLQIFFQDAASAYAVWSEEGRYKAALRLESYGDGFLITALETHPAVRNRGYGTRLLEAVVSYHRENRTEPLYSHIHRENRASITVHKKCGFSVIAHDAVFLDGSRQSDYLTFSLER